MDPTDTVPPAQSSPENLEDLALEEDYALSAEFVRMVVDAADRRDTVRVRELMAALHIVDAIVIFNEDTPLELISYLKPDVLVKGGDYTVKTIVGADVVLEHGGRVEVIPFETGFSTTNLIQKIKNGEE